MNKKRHQHCCQCKRLTKYAPITHVIFDLDGTIIDSEHVYSKALKHAVENYGFKYEEDFILKIKGRVEKEMGRIAVEHFKLQCKVEDFLDTYNEYANRYLGDLDLLPGAEKIIKHLYKANVPICIATSSNQNSFDLKMKKFPHLLECFHHVVCGGTDPEVTNGKPATDIFLVAASRFEQPTPKPINCLVFEDSVNGLKAGLAAGMQVVMIPDNQVSYNEWKMATIRLDSFNYMLPELFDLPAYPQNQISEELATTKVSEIKINASALIQSLRRDLISFGKPLEQIFRRYQYLFGPPLESAGSETSSDELGRSMSKGDSDSSFERRDWEFAWPKWKKDRKYANAEYPAYAVGRSKKGLSAHYGLGFEFADFKDPAFPISRRERVPKNPHYSRKLGWGFGRPDWKRNEKEGGREHFPYPRSFQESDDAFNGRKWWEFEGPDWNRREKDHASGGPKHLGRGFRNPEVGYDEMEWKFEWPNWKRDKKDDSSYINNRIGRGPGVGRGWDFRWPEWNKDEQEYQGEKAKKGAVDEDAYGGREWPDWERNKKYQTNGRTKDSPYAVAKSGREPEDSYGGWEFGHLNWPGWQRNKNEYAAYAKGRTKPVDTYGGKAWEFGWPEWKRKQKDNAGPGPERSGYTRSLKESDDIIYDDRGWEWPNWKSDRPGGEVDQTKDVRAYGGKEWNFGWPEWKKNKKYYSGGGPKDSSYARNGRDPGNPYDRWEFENFNWPEWNRNRKEYNEYPEQTAKTRTGKEPEEDYGGRGWEFRWPEWNKNRKEYNGEAPEHSAYEKGRSIKEVDEPYGGYAYGGIFGLSKWKRETKDTSTDVGEFSDWKRQKQYRSDGQIEHSPYAANKRELGDAYSGGIGSEFGNAYEGKTWEFGWPKWKRDGKGIADDEISDWEWPKWNRNKKDRAGDEIEEPENVDAVDESGKYGNRWRWRRNRKDNADDEIDEDANAINETEKVGTKWGWRKNKRDGEETEGVDDSRKRDTKDKLKVDDSDKNVSKSGKWKKNKQDNVDEEAERATIEDDTQKDTSKWRWKKIKNIYINKTDNKKTAIEEDKKILLDDEKYKTIT